MDKTELVEELRNMADELASENWGARYPFDDIAEAMRQAASSLSQAEGGEARLSDAVQLQAAYRLGWHRAAKWANRDDLHSDVGSPAYLKDMAADLSPIASPTQEAVSERTAEPWTYRWHGSAPDKGWTILQGRETVVYIGGDESLSDAVHAICEAHNKEVCHVAS